jgi:hypothetical protein
MYPLEAASSKRRCQEALQRLTTGHPEPDGLRYSGGRIVATSR